MIPATDFRRLPLAPHLLPARDAMLELIDEMVEAIGRPRTRWFVEQLQGALQEPPQ